MRPVPASKLLVLAIALWAGSAATVLAQDAATPPALPQNPLPGTGAQQPPPPAAAGDLQSCLQETGDYVTRGRAITYVIGIANTCDKRLRCEIFANVTGAKGTSLGHAVMILGPAKNGAAAKKTYDMRVKAAGGIAQVSRECKVL